jgi:hypothetical protein
MEVLGHVVHIADVDNTTIFYGKPEGKKQQARRISNLENRLLNWKRNGQMSVLFRKGTDI